MSHFPAPSFRADRCGLISERRLYLCESDKGCVRTWDVLGREMMSKKLIAVQFGRCFSDFFPWLTTARAAISVSSCPAFCGRSCCSLCRSLPNVLCPAPFLSLWSFHLFHSPAPPLPPASSHVSQADLEVPIPFPLPPRYWDYTCQVSAVPGINNGASFLVGQALCQLSYLLRTSVFSNVPLASRMTSFSRPINSLSSTAPLCQSPSSGLSKSHTLRCLHILLGVQRGRGKGRTET